MRRRDVLLVLFLVVFAASGAAGCTKKGGPRAASRPETVAMAGERPVTLGEFMAWAKKATSEDPKNVSPRVLSSLLDQYLEEVLLARAVEAAVPPVPGANPVEKRRAFLARSAGLETLQDSDLRKEFDAHPERYKSPALVRASQLLFRDKESADAAVKRLDLGATWLDVSKESSVAPNAASGGSLGLLSRADLPREFEKAVWSLPAGKRSPVVATPHGFHVFRVDERLDARDVTFEEALPALRMAVAEDRSSKALEEAIAGARLRFPVTIVEDHLPFPYVGTNAHDTASR
ncbi:MAG TPA: peptidylprolyl isomerase [Thermoanaerobaculia bacterium]|nr:peptidylprolyl isomerase [Thermoanaerobaculia bacterium]